MKVLNLQLDCDYDRKNDKYICLDFSKVLFKLEVESSTSYFYDLLENECIKLKVDFSSVLVTLLIYDIKLKDLVIFD